MNVAIDETCSLAVQLYTGVSGGHENLVASDAHTYVNAALVVGPLHLAVAAANAADVVILAIGESENMSGEAQSRAEIVIPAPQMELAEAVGAAATLEKPFDEADLLDAVDDVVKNRQPSQMVS